MNKYDSQEMKTGDIAQVIFVHMNSTYIHMSTKSEVSTTYILKVIGMNIAKREHIGYQIMTT